MSGTRQQSPIVLAGLVACLLASVSATIAQEHGQAAGGKNQRGWSPDGERIVFFLPWDGEGPERDVYVVDRDGSNLQNVTCNDVEDANPAWSPDGEWIAYFSRVGEWFQIVMARPDGSGRLAITSHPSHNHSPEWSPDGSEILFESNRDGPWELYRITYPRGQARRVTDTTDRDGRPSWYAGEAVTYYSNRDGDNEIFVLDLASLEVTQVTRNEASDYNPSWLGRDAVLFISDRDGDDEIFHASLKDGGAKQLTANEASDWNPYASPDGTTISFYSDRDGGEGLYLMDSDGANQRRLVSAAQVAAATARCEHRRTPVDTGPAGAR